MSSNLDAKWYSHVTLRLVRASSPISQTTIPLDGYHFAKTCCILTDGLSVYLVYMRASSKGKVEQPPLDIAKDVVVFASLVAEHDKEVSLCPFIFQTCHCSLHPNAASNSVNEEFTTYSSQMVVYPASYLLYSF